MTQFSLNDQQQLDLFVYAMRYAFGRRTSAPSDVANTIADHWPNLCETSKTIILRDLKTEIEYHDRMRSKGSNLRPLGDDCDRQTWGNLLDKLQSGST